MRLRDRQSNLGYLIFISIAVVSLGMISIFTNCGPKNANPVTVTIDTETRYQTIEGWGATLPALGVPLEEWLKNPKLDKVRQWLEDK